jgi:hypothetical protein
MLSTSPSDVCNRAGDLRFSKPPLVKPASNRFNDRMFCVTSVEETLLHCHNGFAFGQPSDALCFICALAVVSLTAAAAVVTTVECL